MTMVSHGIGVSRGIAIGKAHIARRNQLEITQRTITHEHVEREVKRFRNAVVEARRELRQVKEKIPSSTPAEILEFIDAHVLMLEDGALTDPPVQIIRDEECNSEWALQVHRNRLAAAFDDMDDPYLASRIEDVDQVISRIQRQLEGEKDKEHHHDYEGIVLIADDLAPADLTLLHHEGLTGLITEFGGPLSHTAILARSLRIPAAMGIRHARQIVREGEQVIVDGQRGIIIADSSRSVVGFYRGRLKDEQNRLATLKQLKRIHSRTRCGTPIRLEANVDLPDDIALLDAEELDGVGLYRTEFLFMNRGCAPDEDEQFEAYKQIVDRMEGKPVTIRTLDLGADKQIDGRKNRGTVPVNPALGLRAIRMCLNDHGLFVPQLRAIVRAAAEGPVRILIPMLSTAQEIFQVRNMISAVTEDLRREGVEVPDNIPVGGMIEVPAAAIAAHTFVKYLDFLSIGTNDLIQYTLAIDRIDDSVSYLYDPLHPAIIKLLSIVLDAGKRSGTPISMCGEMAGDPLMTRLLMSMGLDTFSMHPGSILEVKQMITSTRLDAIHPVTKRLLRATNPLRIQTLLRELNEHK